jgi:hypothetical protein
MCNIVGNAVENKIEEIQGLSNKTTDMTLTQLEATLASLGEIVAKKRAMKSILGEIQAAQQKQFSQFYMRGFFGVRCSRVFICRSASASPDHPHSFGT